MAGEIYIGRKTNTINLGGNFFQANASNGLVASAGNGTTVTITDSATSKVIVANAPYDKLLNLGGTAFGGSQSTVITVLNAYFQSDDPDLVVTGKDTVLKLDGVEQFTTAKAGELLAVGGAKNGAIVTTGATVNSFLQPNTAISVTTINASSTIDATGAIRSESYLAGDYIRLEGSTNNSFETTLQVVDPTQDNTITFPDASGTVALLSDISAGGGVGTSGTPLSNQVAVFTDQDTIEGSTVLTVDGVNEVVRINDSVDLSWNPTDGALDIAYDNGVTLQVGQEEHFYAKATEAIDNGDIVMFAGAQGNHLLIAKADMDAAGFFPEAVVGVATQDFANNEFGYVTSFGKVRGLDTNSLNEGDLIYLDPNTPGGYVTSEPTPPDHIILVATVTRSHQNQGTIFVRPSHKPDSDEVPEGSTNLYLTSAERTKLTGIEAGAEVNVQSDWNASSGDALILNKPSIPTSLDELGGNADDIAEGQSNKFFTSAERTKLSGIAAGAEVNVNADWNSSSGDSQILNKPTIPSSIGDLAEVPSSLGSTGQVLAVNSSGTALEYVNQSGGGGGIDTTGTIFPGAIPIFTDSDTVKGDSNFAVIGTTIVSTYDMSVAQLGVSGLTLSATGNATITGFSSGDIEISSKGNLSIQLDSDNNETSQSFTILDPATTERFKVSDTGVVTINEEFSLPNTDGTAGQVLSTDGNGNVTWKDEDNYSIYIDVSFNGSLDDIKKGQVVAVDRAMENEIDPNFVYTILNPTNPNYDISSVIGIATEDIDLFTSLNTKALVRGSIEVDVADFEALHPNADIPEGGVRAVYFDDTLIYGGLTTTKPSSNVIYMGQVFHKPIGPNDYIYKIAVDVDIAGGGAAAGSEGVSPVGAMAKTTSQPLTTTLTPVANFDQTWFDVLSIFDATTGKLTISDDGSYHITAIVTFDMSAFVDRESPYAVLRVPSYGNLELTPRAYAYQRNETNGEATVNLDFVYPHGGPPVDFEIAVASTIGTSTTSVINAQFSYAFIGGSQGPAGPKGDKGDTFEVIEEYYGRDLTIDDNLKYILCYNSSPITFTVPNLFWPDGTEIVFEQADTGQITIAAGPNVTVNSSETLKSGKQYSVIGLKKVGTSTWTLTGEREAL
jgi:hypothetical protein